VNVLFEMVQESHFYNGKVYWNSGAPEVGLREAIADDDVMGQERPSCVPDPI